LSAAGGTNSLVSVDAMQEFRIQTSSFAPEFGRTPGAQISIVTRSGTNLLHGTLFEYFRNDVLDAKDWFVNFNGLPKPAERQNDFGGVLRGPIWNDKTFFFFFVRGTTAAAAGSCGHSTVLERVSDCERARAWRWHPAIQRRLFESFLAGCDQHPDRSRF
jgi:hypothetical protein